LTEKEQKISWHSFLRHGVVTVIDKGYELRIFLKDQDQDQNFISFGVHYKKEILNSPPYSICSTALPIGVGDKGNLPHTHQKSGKYFSANIK